MMYPQVLRTPLRQAMALLWLLGLAHLVGRAAVQDIGLQWVLTAGLGALVASLMLGHYRFPQGLVVPFLAGLGCALGLSAWLSGPRPAALPAPAAVYALLGWWLAVRAARTSTPRLLLERLGILATDTGRSGQALLLARTAVATAVVASVAAVAGSGMLAPHGPSTIFGPAVALLATAVLAGLVGWRYRASRYAHVGLLALSWLALQSLAHAEAHSLAELLANPWAGGLLALLSLGYWSLARVLDAREVSPAGVYLLPLRLWCVTLGGLAAAQQLLLVTDAGSAMGVSPAAVLLLSALTLGLGNHRLRLPVLTVLSLALGALAIVWTHAVMLGTADLPLPWRLPGATLDPWLSVGLLALAMAAAASVLMERSPPYAGALRIAAALSWVWSLTASAAALAREPDIVLTALLVVQALALPLLLETRRGAAILGGAGTALLLGALPWGLGAVPGLLPWWALGLWAGAAFILPRLRLRWSRWPMDGRPWAWTGLALVAWYVLLTLSPQHWHPLGLASLYLALMLRVSASRLLPWALAAALAAVGVSFALSWQAPFAWRTWAGAPPYGFAVMTILWANLLLAASALWRRHGSRLLERAGCPPQDLALALESAGVALLGAWLALAVTLLLAAMERGSPASWQPVGLALLLALSAWHWLWRRPGAGPAHVLLLTVLCSYLAIALKIGIVPMAPVLAAWAVLVLLAYLVLERRAAHPSVGVLTATMADWLPWLPLPAVGVWLATRPLDSAVLASTLALLVAFCAGLSTRLHPRLWLGLAFGSLAAVLHILPRLIGGDDAGPLLPWNALSMAVLGWALRVLALRCPPAESDAQSSFRAELGWAARHTWPLAAGLALVEWTYALALSLVLPGLDTGIAGWAGIGAGAVLVLLAVREAWRLQSEPAAYLAGVLTLLAGYHLRVLLFGPAPSTGWDAAALIAAAMVALLVARRTGSRAVLHMALALPVLAALAVPYSLASGTTTRVLAGVAAYYLLAAQTSQQRVPLYLALLAMNAAVYLWVPGWSDHYSLLQLYTIPAALSVLAVLHLHRAELRRGVLNATRLAALSTLYASVTLDVFLQSGLGAFLAAVALSLAGVVVGIALRVRAFLFAGVAFLVLNVGGQLLQLYPEGRLGRAILLLLLGTVITAGMLWFSIKREAILRRIRIYRADLAQWA